jgi:hypothetical protein
LISVEPTALWPRAHTRLFLSADIAGSTAYKQRKAADESASTDKWAPAILSFYRDFGRVFLDKLTLTEGLTASSFSKYKKCVRPLFWKAVGDEVLFCLELSSEKQAYVAIAAWINAAREYKDTLGKERLDVKLAAWLATFPTPNFEVPLPRALDESAFQAQSNDDALVANWEALRRYYTGTAVEQMKFSLDFIGPAMDTGFRVAQQSTTRKMAVTPELAQLVALTHHDFETQAQFDDGHRLVLRFSGRTTLKGVSDPSGYPVFWIDVAKKDDKFVQVEDKLEPSHHSTDIRDISTFLELYLANRAPFKTLVYLPDGERSEFCTLHQELKDQLEKIELQNDLERKRLENEMNQDEAKAQSHEKALSADDLEKLVDALNKWDAAVGNKEK